jgi:hypothetical protein
MSEETRDDRYADVDTSHLEDVEDGCGCAEIWEHTAEREADDGPSTEDVTPDTETDESVEAEASD